MSRLGGFGWGFRLIRPMYKTKSTCPPMTSPVARHAWWALVGSGIWLIVYATQLLLGVSCLGFASDLHHVGRSDNGKSQRRQASMHYHAFQRQGRERERECKIPLYNLDSESNLDMRSILNPLKSHNSLFMRPGSCPVWLGPVLSQCHSASLHPLMHLEHYMLS